MVWNCSILNQHLQDRFQGFFGFSASCRRRLRRYILVFDRSWMFVGYTRFYGMEQHAWHHSHLSCHTPRRCNVTRTSPSSTVGRTDGTKSSGVACLCREAHVPLCFRNNRWDKILCCCCSKYTHGELFKENGLNMCVLSCDIFPPGRRK